MQTGSFPQVTGDAWRRAFTIIIGLAMVAGLMLSFLSLFEVCTSGCSAGSQYRIFGVPFSPFGVTFFTFANLLWWGGFKESRLLLPLKLLVGSAFGAEIYFLYLQKYVIRQWCPVCLSIFVCVAVLAIVFAAMEIKQYRQAMMTNNRSEAMRHLRTGLSSLGAVAVGLLMVIVGVTKTQSVYADAVGEKTLFFGKSTAPVDVYVFTDWFCPACRKAEPFIELKGPEIAKKARLFFIDVPIHDDSMNYVPYNLSFLLNEKVNYLTLRNKLAHLAGDDKEKRPTDAQVEKIAESVGTTYKQLNYAEVAQGVKFFQEVAAKYGVDSTPIVIIVNPKSKKMKRLTGVKEIKKADFTKLIDEVTGKE